MLDDLKKPMSHSMDKAKDVFASTWRTLPPGAKLEAVGVITFNPSANVLGVPVRFDGTYGPTGDLFKDLAAEMSRNRSAWEPLSRHVLLDANGRRLGEINWDGKGLYEATR